MSSLLGSSVVGCALLLAVTAAGQTTVPKFTDQTASTAIFAKYDPQFFPHFDYMGAGGRPTVPFDVPAAGARGPVTAGKPTAGLTV